MRGVTYRSQTLTMNQERAIKASFYLSVLTLLDVLCRRFGSLLLRSSSSLEGALSKYSWPLRLLLLWGPFAGWVLSGPLHPSTCTRDDRGMSQACLRWSLWQWMRALFSHRTSMVLSEEWRKLSPHEIYRLTEEHKEPYLIPMHPHGVLPLGGIINGLTWAGGGLQCRTASGQDVTKPKNPGQGLHQAFFPHLELRAAVASGVFWFPGFHEMYKKLGCIECTKPYMKEILRRGRSLAVYPGGASESRYARPGKYVCYVLKRKGFLRVALEEHVDLVPIWTFGDEAILPQMSWQHDSPRDAVLSIQQLLKSVFGLLVPPMPGGLPKFGPLTSVVGLPVSLKDLWPPEKGGTATEAAVDEAHRRYLEAVKTLFDLNKVHVPGGHQDAQLEFV